MNRARTPSLAEVGLTALAALTTVLTLLTWRSFAVDATSYLGPVTVAALGVGALGLLLRALGGGRLIVLTTQLVVVGLVLHRSWAPSDQLGGWLPTRSSLGELGAVIARASEEAGQFAAPVPADATAFPPLLVLAGVAVVIAVDFLAATLRMVPLAGLPLLAAFTAPVSVTGGASATAFVLAGASFTAMLTVAQADRLSQWGRSVSAASSSLWSGVDTGPTRIRVGTLWPTAGRIAAVGLGVAVLAPALVPETTELWGGGEGDGSGSNGEVELTNPIIDVRRNLVRGDDVPLVLIQTSDPTPAYLRIAVLDEFDGGSWRPSDRDVPPINRADGALPIPTGLSATIPRQEHSFTVQVTDELASTWLPLPFPSARVEVPGDWRFDSQTLDVLSADEGVTTKNLRYQGVSLDLLPPVETMVTAPPPPNALQQIFTRLPGDLPGWMEDLAVDVSEGADSQFERAVQIQEWFRRDGGFTYSLEPDDGNGLQTLETFLGSGAGSRIGYCEQFASGMAVLTRSLGIPTRLAVGFLSPDREVSSILGPGGQPTWTYSAWDLHTWPELYFAGVGWVRFEPTPPARAGSVPSYTAGEVPSPAQLGTPTDGPSAAAPQDTQRQEDAGPEGQDSETGTSAFSWAIPATLLALLVVLLLAPRAARAWLRRRRGRRVGDPGAAVEHAWAEVRATAVDLGVVAWDDGGTVRDQAAGVREALSSEAPAVDDVAALVALLERARYSSRDLDPHDAARARSAGRRVTEALTAAVSRNTRRRAAWLPSSLWRGQGQMRLTAAEIFGPGTPSGPEAAQQAQDQERVSV